MKYTHLFILALILLFVVFFSLSIPTYASEVDTSVQDTVEDTETEKTVTQTAAEWLAENVGAITGVISSVGLVVLSWLIKKALIPAVTSAIKTVADKSAASEGSFKKQTDTVISALELSGQYLDDCSRRVDTMIADWQKKAAAQGKAYELQTDLINYLLINLRIPNELKAEVATRAEAVKAALKEASEV